MKKYLFFAMCLLAASCVKENASGIDPEVPMHEITVIASEKPAADPSGAQPSRTTLYKPADKWLVKWSESGEYIRIYQVATPTGEGAVSRDKKKSSVGTTSDDGLTMSFTASLEMVADADYSYYAFYPNSAMYNSSDNETSVRINTPATQTPSATTFDPSADLLIAKGVDAGSSQPASLAARIFSS